MAGFNPPRMKTPNPALARPELQPPPINVVQPQAAGPVMGPMGMQAPAFQSQQQPQLSGWALAKQGFANARAQYPGFGTRRKQQEGIKTMYAKRTQPAGSKGQSGKTTPAGGTRQKPPNLYPEF